MITGNKNIQWAVNQTEFNNSTGYLDSFSTFRLTRDRVLHRYPGSTKRNESHQASRVLEIPGSGAFGDAHHTNLNQGKSILGHPLRHMTSLRSELHLEM